MARELLFQGKDAETGEWDNLVYSVANASDLDNLVGLARISGYQTFSFISDEGRTLVESRANGAIEFNLSGYRF